MRVLVVGSGGREHALVEAISRSRLEPEIFCAPGNVGTASLGRNVEIPAEDIPALRDFARENGIELTIVGPEAPLIGGIADAFYESGLKLFGPSRAAARIEGSKSFAKEVMGAAGVPTAEHRAFDREQPALDYLRTHPLPVVVKADGAASGKGVTVAHSREEAEAAVREVFGGRFGYPGQCVVIEEHMTGREVSILAVTDGEDILPFLPVQDFKRIYDEDRGPNTGGMGSYSPLPWLEPQTYRRILEEIIRPTVQHLSMIGSSYTGLLYAGVMVTDEGPKALEFNCRFGDPETQALLPRIGSDLLELMVACCDGELAGREVGWSAESSVCVVLASDGYPESSSSGDEISGLDNLPEGVRLYHAATEQRGTKLYTAGGRVLNIVGLGGSLMEARALAYAAAELVHFPGMQYRTDIALEAMEMEEF